MLCLDLSESMNKESGVSPMAGRGVLEEDKFDAETASFKLLDDVKDVSEDIVLENGETRFFARQGPKKRFLMRRLTAKGYLRKQHPSCHHAWKFYLQGNSGNENKLLHDLGTMARRDALNLSLTLEANQGNRQMKNQMLEVRRPVSGFECHIYNIGCSRHILRLHVIGTSRG